MLDYVPDDGYTEDATISAVPQIHNEFQFSYRPVVGVERTRIYALASKTSDEDYIRKCAELAASKITAWSLRDRQGQAVAITPEAVLKLKTRLWNRLYAIILGAEPSDEGPKTTGETKTEADAKN